MVPAAWVCGQSALCGGGDHARPLKTMRMQDDGEVKWRSHFLGPTLGRGSEKRAADGGDDARRCFLGLLIGFSARGMWLHDGENSEQCHQVMFRAVMRRSG